MTVSTKFSLEQLVSLYRQMQPRRWEKGQLCGALSVQNDATAVLLQDLLQEENAEDYPCEVVAGNPEKVRVGDQFELKFGIVQTAVGSVVSDVDALLRNFQLAAGVVEPAWYVSSLDVASWDVDSELVRRLKLVKRLVAVLSQSAAIYDSQKCVLIFLRGGRFDVPVRYGENDLMGFNVAAAEKIIAALEVKDGHAPQRSEICATAVCELLANDVSAERFKSLLRRVEELHQRVVDGYKLFASSFSYEKVRDQVEGLRIEYTGKIHKTISDIQSHLLGIPVSTVVVATQFKSVTASPDQVWINTAVLIGAFFFFVVLAVALWNQRQTLEVIQQEVARHENVLRKDNAAIADRLQDVFDSLRERIALHGVGLLVIFLVALTGLLVAFSFYLILLNAGR